AQFRPRGARPARDPARPRAGDPARPPRARARRRHPLERRARAPHPPLARALHRRPLQRQHHARRRPRGDRRPEGAAMTNPALRIRALEKRYGSHTALRGIDRAVPPGAVHGVIGPNGAGTTTTTPLLPAPPPPSAGGVPVAE